MKKLLLICITLLLILCVSKNNKETDETQIVKTKIAQNNDGNIVTLPYLGYMKGIFGNLDDLNNCELLNDEYIKINSILIECISEYNDKILKLKDSEYLLLKDSDYYDRQYICVENNSKEKVVYVNCFPKGSFSGENDLVVVRDGGPDYFRLKINLNTGKYYDLYINGFA